MVVDHNFAANIFCPLLYIDKSISLLAQFFYFKTMAVIMYFHLK